MAIMETEIVEQVVEGKCTTSGKGYNYKVILPNPTSRSSIYIHEYVAYCSQRLTP